MALREHRYRVRALQLGAGGGDALLRDLDALVAAWRGIGACEIFAISNWLRGRDDRLGCPLFLPIGAAEAALSRR